MSSEISVADDPDNDRYVIDADGARVGVLTYQLGPGQIALLHAEISPAVERQGLGSELVAYALSDARARGLAVLPYCPFVRSYIAEHDEYQELVPEQGRRLGPP